MLTFVALLALSLPNVEDRGYAHIQRQLPGLTFREARTLLREARLAERPPAPQSKIEHMVVLFVENRAADHSRGEAHVAIELLVFQHEHVQPCTVPGRPCLRHRT
jgi:hypothetical protein